MSRPKGSKNKVKSEKAESKVKISSSKAEKSAPLHFIPYEKSKLNKQGELVTYQTYKSGDSWLIDIFTGNNLTIEGYDNNITKLCDACRFIDSDLARLDLDK